MLGGLYNVTPMAATRLNDNYTTLDSNYGGWTQVANSFNLNVTARMRNGLMLQGGFNTGQSSNDYCEVRRAIPGVDGDPAPQSPTNPWCDTSSGWVTRATALGSYTIPKIDVQVAGTLRSDQGAPLAANWTAPNSATVGLNRPFAGIGGQTITVNLIEPGTLYGDRVTQIDMRFAKILQVRPHALDGGAGYLQHHQLRRGVDLQPDLRADDRHVAAAKQRLAGALREVQRADGFLESERQLPTSQFPTPKCPGVGGWEWQSATRSSATRLRLSCCRAVDQIAPVAQFVGERRLAERSFGVRHRRDVFVPLGRKLDAVFRDDAG